MLILRRSGFTTMLGAMFGVAIAVAAPAAAFAGDGRGWVENDRYHEVVFDDVLDGRPDDGTADGTPGERRYWTAKCPADYPFLDGSVTNQFETGRGLVVRAPYQRVWLGEVSDGGLRDWIKVGDGSWRTGGTTGHLENRTTAPIPVYLEMVCSADERDGWRP